MTLDYGWWDSLYEHFTSICEILGFDVSQRDINFSGFWSQGDGASFTGSYSYTKGAAKSIREYVPNDAKLHAIADSLQEVQRRNFYQLSASICRVSHHYVHESTCRVNYVERDSHNYQDPTSDAEEIIEEARLSLCHWLYSRLESEYEYLSAWESGMKARIAANGALEIGREYVETRRHICRVWSQRGHAGVRLLIKRLVGEARGQWESYVYARDDARNLRNELDEIGRESYAEGV